MATMIATYERDKALNVREEPRVGARVVRRMRHGDSEECLEVRDGWARLADGFVDASLVLVHVGEVTEGPAKAAAEATERPVGPGTPEAPEAPAGDDETAELRKMTNAQLYEMAAQCGVKVRKGAKKEELIEAIVGND